MLSSHQENSPFLLDALFCDEQQHWDERESCFFQAEREEEEEGLLPQPFDDEELHTLLKKEQEYQLYSDSPAFAKPREDAVDWMLKVIAYYSFSTLTAVLAVNYLDRFLCSFRSDHSDKPWMTQLAAVACLSLAAKVDEIQVPLLLDLQVEEPKFLFEAKNIKKMEILILSTLQWKMNPVTPLSFLDYFTRRLQLKSPQICCGFLSRCERLILSLISDSRFVGLLPSALASATMLFVITSLNPCIGLDYQDQVAAIPGINKEKVQDCCVLIQKVAALKKRKLGCLPCGSPKGVFDASFSCDSSNDSWAVSSSPEPLFKKIKFHETPNTTQFSES